MKGKNYLSFQMAKDLTSRFLKSEIKFLEKQTEPVFIEALEQLYEAKLELEIHGVKKKVALRGYIDRIDSIGGKIRIIDYKSGKVDSGDVIIGGNGPEEEMILKSLKEKKHVLQLAQYAFLYKQKHNKIPASSIISFVSNNQELLTLNSTKVNIEEVVKSYPDYLAQIISEIYDPEHPFEHKESGWFSTCDYCQ
jgi:CRISPR/Cas system-associated exonuclease Cas4 (RecB family)